MAVAAVGGSRRSGPAGGAGLGQERGLVDQHPRHPSGAHEATAVAFEAGRRDGEREATTLDLDQGGLGQHDLPMPTGAKWSNWTRVATLDCSAVRCPSVARSAASSHMAMSRGVARTGTSPERKYCAVSSAPTVSSTWAVRPECGPCPAGGVLPLPEGELGTTITIPPVTDTSLIDPDVLQNVLGAALSHGGDMAEVFAEDSLTASAMLDDRRVEELSSGRSRGAGIRVVAGETTGFAHTSDLSEAGLLAAAAAAASVAREGGGTVRTVAMPSGPTFSHDRGDADAARARCPSPPSSTSWSGPTRRRGPRAASISQVQVGCGDSHRRILIANSDGLWAEDDQVRTRFNVMCVANGDTGMQTGYESLARTEGFEIFERYKVEDIARTAATRALAKLSARPAPSGEVPIVLAGGSGGILFHEACGHGLEADHIVKDASVYTGQMGKLVASPLVTLVDDGTVLGEWGNFAVDDEGNAPARNVLIENGVLTDYMWDWLRARKEGRKSSGNGRRQSLPASANGADDQHLSSGRHRERGRNRGPDTNRGLCLQARRWSGQHDDRRLRVRDDRGVPHRGRPPHRAVARRQPDRERTRGAPPHRCRGR